MGSISDEEIKQFLSQNDDCKIKPEDVKSALNYLEIEKGYYSLKIIGSGSFGLVVSVSSPNGDEQAVKIIVSNLEEHIKKASIEAEVIKKVKSPHVVKYFDHFVSLKLKTFFLVTEYCSKGNLRSLLSDNKGLTKEEIVNLSLELLYGLRDLQKFEIIHCDLKPDNILISNDGKLKICDFGLAKLVLNRKAYATNLGNILYMPPEGFTDIQNKDGKYIVAYSYDIYSLGGIIIYLCNPKLEQSLNAIKGGTFPNVAGHPLENFYKIAFSMMSIEPAQRQTLSQTIQLFEQLVSKEEIIIQSEEPFDSVRRKIQDCREKLQKKIKETFAS